MVEEVKTSRYHLSMLWNLTVSWGDPWYQGAGQVALFFGYSEIKSVLVLKKCNIGPFPTTHQDGEDIHDERPTSHNKTSHH